MTESTEGERWAAFRRTMLRGSALEAAGFGTSQVVRLASNVVLAWLMFPAAFGLVALVYVIVDGLTMLSDVGIEQAVVHDQRGDEQKFLDTAFTIQVVRGFFLWLAATSLAWPAAQFYGEPLLLQIVPVGALTVVITGLHSTSLFTLRRRVEVGKIVALDLGAQVCAVVVMIPLAFLDGGVWALLAGGLAGAAFKSIGSHLIRVGYRNRFAWDPEARAAIVRFGKWIFGSSAVFFFYRQGDRLLLGRFLGVGELGVYSFAVVLAEGVTTAVGRITRGVLMPLFAQVRHEGTDNLREIYYRTRLRLDAVWMPGAGLLLFLGEPIIDLLYDDRYADAGWILQALAVRVGMGAMLSPCESCMIAIGETRYLLYQNVGRAAWILVGIPLVWQFAGLEGLVAVVATSEIPAFFVMWTAFHRQGLLRIRRELLACGFFVVGVAIGYALRVLFYTLFPA